MSSEPSLYRRPLSRWWSIKRTCDMHHLPRETRLPIMFDKRNYRTSRGFSPDRVLNVVLIWHLTSCRGGMIQQRLQVRCMTVKTNKGPHEATLFRLDLLRSALPA